MNCGAEMVEYNKPVTSGEDETAEMVLSLLGVAEEDMESFAISLSGMNIKAYAIALIMPAADKAEAVLESVNAYVATQQQSFETYLADQYEIAKNAKVETLEDGTILLVMTENGDKVYDAIVGALEAK